MRHAPPKKVYYHETRDVCEGLPGLLGRFPLRALLVAKPGERVVLPAGRRPTELPLLNRLGFGPRHEDLIEVDDDGRIASGDGDLEGATMLPFSGTSSLGRTFAARHRAELHAPDLKTCLQANSKGVFQDIVNMLGERGAKAGPRGAVVRRGAALRQADEFRDREGRAIVKGQHSASGLQQVIVGPGTVAADLDGLPSTVVVQEWVAHDCSPSVQCCIDPMGGVETLSITEQILDGTHHIGNRFPPDLLPSIGMHMVRIAGDIGRALSAIGYWGVCGVDFLVREEGHVVLANEVNARIPAPWYPWQASRRRFGKPLPFRMKSARLAPGTPIGDVERAVGPMLFDARKREGFVPFCFVPEQGFVYGVTYSPDRDRVAGLASDVDARLADLAP